MKTLFIGLLLIAQFIPVTAYADGVPRCWVADQPDQNIQDGIFRVFIPTANQTALTVAYVFAIVSQSMAAQVGTGTNYDLSHIEIDLFGNLQYWKPTGMFPTLESFKNYILASIAPVLNQPGVTVECAKNSSPMPTPIE